MHLTNLLAIVTSILVIVAYIAINVFDSLKGKIWFSFFNSVLPSLFAVLIAYLIVSVFLARKKLSPSQILKAEIVKDVTDSRIKELTFLSENEANQLFNITEKLQGAKKFDLLGYTLVNLLTYNMPFFIEALQNACKIRLLIIEPKSAASHLLSENQTLADIEVDIQKVMNLVKMLRDNIANSKNPNSGEILIKFMNWIPGYSTMILNSDIDNGQLRIRYYPVHNAINHSMIIQYGVIEKKRQVELFEHYRKQFEDCWKISKNEQEILIVE